MKHLGNMAAPTKSTAASPAKTGAPQAGAGAGAGKSQANTVAYGPLGIR